MEKTIDSVLDQQYPNLEYIIIDGGSTDGSLELIRKYAHRISYWVSEEDSGQVNAINKGLRLATGDWVAWQNSDDVYHPGSFMSFANAVASHSKAQIIIANMNVIDREGCILRKMKYVKPTYHSLLAECMVLTNQSAFWRRDLHEKIGLLDESLNCAFDYEWFLRILQHGAQSIHINAVWGSLRMHCDTKTSNLKDIFENEFSRVLSGRKPIWIVIKLYQIRRLLLTALNGELTYIVKGIRNRVISKVFQ